MNVVTYIGGERKLMFLFRLMAEMALVESIRRAITSKKLARTRQKLGKIIEKNIIAGNFSSDKYKEQQNSNTKITSLVMALHPILEELKGIREDLKKYESQRIQDRSQDRAQVAAAIVATRKPWTPWS